MSTDQERLQELDAAYRRLWDQHQALKDEIRENYTELKEFRERMGLVPETVQQPLAEKVNPITTSSPVIPSADQAPKTKEPSNWEQYIGEQLLSKAGIAILVIGVGIGAKYAIDHRLMSPGMRILGGYIVAAILGFFAFRFRTNYSAFSAVLISGAMAVCYFITYAAYSFYGIYPYWLAFVLLLLTTGGTVFSAVRYNQQIIAHIGLIGAYVLPVLISAKSSHFSNYLSYMLVINGGILALSFLRNWKSLYHVAFGWTTFVFIMWFFTSYNETTDAPTALGFATAFFLLFHSAALAFPFYRRQQFEGIDLFLVVPNMTAFFGIGQYVIHSGNFPGSADFIFGILISVMFFLLWQLFRKIRPADQLLQETHGVIGLGALTLSLIVQLSGPALPLILAVETLILAWLALRSSWKFLDIFATVLLSVTGVFFLYALFDKEEWLITIVPFANPSFLMLTGCALIVSFGYGILKRIFPQERQEQFGIVPGLLIFGLTAGFLALFFETAFLFDHLHTIELSTDKELTRNSYAIDSIYTAMQMTLISFSIAYWTFVVWLNQLVIKLKSASWMQVVSICLIFSSLLAVTIISGTGIDNFGSNERMFIVYTTARYISFAAVLFLGWPVVRSVIKSPFLMTAIHVSLLWMLSLELVQWLNFSGNKSAYKLSLSILWALYATYLLYLGIRKDMGVVRVTGMIVLGITLVKLFFFDIARLSTLSKTVLFMAIGGLLLIGAYFYQRSRGSDQKEES